MLPDIPTLREQGIDAVYEQIFTLFAPKGTPGGRQGADAQGHAEGLNTPEAAKAMAALYCTPAVLSAEESLELWNAQEERNRQLARTYLNQK